MTALAFQDLVVNVDNRGVAQVRLNRPEKHNAFNDQIIQQITDAFTRLGNDAGVKAIVLSGEGPSFSAGADLNWMRGMADKSREQNKADALKLAAMYETIYACPKPVIASVHGNVVAGGTGLAAASDYVVAQEGARFQISEVHLGLRPSTISSYLIPRIGDHNARVLFTGGEKFYANEAKAVGLANVVTADLEQETERVVRRALEIGKPGLRAMRAPPEPSHKPATPRYPDVAALDAAGDEYGRKQNHNKILDLVDGVAERLKNPAPPGRKALMEFTAQDIAEARVSAYAQKKMREFFAAQEKRAAKAN